MGKCNGCEYYKFQDDGNEMTCRCCFKTPKGRAITWSMYVYKPTIFGFIPMVDENYQRKRKLQEYPKTHKEPYWCPLKENEKSTQ